MKKNIPSLRHLIALFLFGLAAGFIADRIYIQQKNIEAENRSLELVDFIIGNWTQTSSDEIIIESNSHLAQFKSELTYRLGFIPDSIRALAVMVEEQYKVPHAVTLAQFILESRWGKNDLGANNVFGHTFAATKKFMSAPRYVIRRDKVSVNGILVEGPQRKFSRYATIEECFNVHGQYLSQSEMYRAAFYTSSPENFARVIALRYAQDPEYAVKLIAIMRRYKLEG